MFFTSRKKGLFSDFQYGFRFSRSTADLLTVVSDRIAWVFNGSGATPAAALDISKASERVRHAEVVQKLKPYETSVLVFCIDSTFLSNRQLRVVAEGKSLPESTINTGVSQGYNNYICVFPTMN